ncbi:MAG: efflux RND transporter periplasmic adaptor subunit [Acidobacteria bacterium]|jgi:RND family efflux transporter MFP subunit|nr:MAG: efflux RND transporter periplasmic adaptor subunit [Acidobacteriota bacterium]
MKGWIKYGLFVVVIALIVLWLAGTFRDKEKPGEVKGETKVVSGLVIEEVRVVEEVPSFYTGHIVADKRVEISSRLMGRVKGVYVKEGDYVSAGKLLVSIDGEDINSQALALEHQRKQAEQAYNSALANFEAVRKTYERYEALIKEGAITQQEFDQVKAQFQSAKAQVEQAKAGIEAVRAQKQAVLSNIKYANLTSPVSGYVVLKNVDTGDLAMPGHPLLVIESGPFLFEAFLPEGLSGKIKVGDAYYIYVSSIDKKVTAKVSEVSPAIDPATRTFRVRLTLKDADGLKSGMYANLIVPERVRAFLLPESAIVKRFDFTGVWVVRPDNTLELRFVKLGERRDGMLEVLSGIKEGERVVIQGVEKACEGCRVGG